MKAWRKYNQKMASNGTPKLKMTKNQARESVPREGPSGLLVALFIKTGLMETP